LTSDMLNLREHWRDFYFIALFILWNNTINISGYNMQS
jgi:hypothetical protein